MLVVSGDLMVSLLVGYAFVASTFLGGGAPAAAIGAGQVTDADVCLDVVKPEAVGASADWGVEPSTVGRRHHGHGLHSLGEGVETEREADDDPEWGEELSVLIALAARFGPTRELPARDDHDGPLGEPWRSSTRTSRGPPAV